MDTMPVTMPVTFFFEHHNVEVQKRRRRRQLRGIWSASTALV
jgi:hypothetical protein